MASRGIPGCARRGRGFSCGGLRREALQAATAPCPSLRPCSALPLGGPFPGSMRHGTGVQVQLCQSVSSLLQVPRSMHGLLLLLAALSALSCGANGPAHTRTPASVSQRTAYNQQAPGRHIAVHAGRRQGSHRRSMASVNRSMSRSVTSHRFATTQGLPAAMYAAVGPTAAAPLPVRFPRLADEHPIKSAAGAGIGKQLELPLRPAMPQPHHTRLRASLW